MANPMLQNTRIRDTENTEIDEENPTHLQPVLAAFGVDTETDVPYTIFTTASQYKIVALCGLAGFFSPFSAFTYFPALEYMAKDLGVSLQLMNLTITLFLLVQGVAPAVLGDLADQVGRRPVYIVALSIYVAACLGLAIQRSYPALLVLRMVQSVGSSGTIALGVMVVADMAPPHARGRAMGAMLSGPNCGPSMGPVIGGVLAQSAGWPWIFWLLAILGGVCLASFALLFPETCRSVVGNGSHAGGRLNEPLFSMLAPSNRRPPPENLKLDHTLRNIPNPLKCLRIVARRHDALLLTSNALFYITYSCLQASLAPLMMQYYGLNALEAGLCYLSYGLATMTSSFLIGKILDIDYQATAEKEGIIIDKIAGDKLAGFPIEKARIRSLLYFVICGIGSSVGFGWTVAARVHLSAPLAMNFVMGVAFTGVFNSCMTLNVDLHPTETGLASVATNVTRCVAAAVAVAALQPLLDSVGVGWTFTIFGLLSSLSIPMLLVLRYYGPQWRGCEWAGR